VNLEAVLASLHQVYYSRQLDSGNALVVIPEVSSASCILSGRAVVQLGLVVNCQRAACLRRPSKICTKTMQIMMALVGSTPSILPAWERYILGHGTRLNFTPSTVQGA
jgi:hypothetical protein